MGERRSSIMGKISHRRDTLGLVGGVGKILRAAPMFPGWRVPFFPATPDTLLAPLPAREDSFSRPWGKIDQTLMVYRTPTPVEVEASASTSTPGSSKTGLAAVGTLHKWRN